MGRFAHLQDHFSRRTSRLGYVSKPSFLLLRMMAGMGTVLLLVLLPVALFLLVQQGRRLRAGQGDPRVVMVFVVVVLLLLLGCALLVWLHSADLPTDCCDPGQ
jgi:hypothetical protein